MDSLARQMRAPRLARGALDFDLPEPFIELDHDDPRLVRAIRKSRRDPGRAAGLLDDRGVHAGRQRGGRAAASTSATRTRCGASTTRPIARGSRSSRCSRENYGIAIDVDEARTPKGLKRVLDRLKGHPAEKPLSFQLLRSLKQATYDVVNLGHFGLASADYLHFTSPIRRYPGSDRPPAAQVPPGAAQGKPAGGFKPPAVAPVPDRAALQKMAADSSFSERAAMEVEREVVDLYRAFFLRDRIGDVFDGVISGVTGFGVFVVVDEPFVEGLVRVEALSDDYYVFDEPACRLVGRRSGRTFALGDTRQGRGAVGQRRAPQGRLRAGRAPRAATTTAAATATAARRRPTSAGRGDKRGRREEKHDRARHGSRRTARPPGQAAR